MMFPIEIYCVALFASAICTALSLPLWRRWSYRTGFVDDPGHRKIHSTPISLAGGLAVMTGLVVPLIVASAILAAGAASTTAPVPENAHASGGLLPSTLKGLFEYGLSVRALQLAAIVAGAFGMVLLGWLYDKYELGPTVKFGGQLVIAGTVAAAGIRITLFVDNVIFSYAITVLWILTVTNAFNFMDNMNGLCAGLAVLGSWNFGLAAAIHGQYLVATMAFLVCGALLGFLPYNFPKASVFLGDTGSHLAGYLMAILGILPHFYTADRPASLAVFTPLAVLALPLLDMAWVVLFRIRIGQPFYIGDTNHLSHRLVRSGCSRTIAVLLIWLMAEAVGSVAFL